jgi:ribosomal protein S18 acetylase RimI-like enzyme
MGRRYCAGVTVALVPITEEQYAARHANLAVGYAQSLHLARGLTPEQARASADKQLAELLPDGRDTALTLMFTATVDDVPVGWIWLALPGSPDRPTAAWVYDIEIDEPYRGKGYGRALMEAAERELISRGVEKLALNVFAYNTPAVKLYESMGFEVMSQQMAKPLRITGESA